MSAAETAQRILEGDRRALARLITGLESGDPGARQTLDLVRTEPAGADVIGVTGPPGAGKSTLVAALLTELRSRGVTVAVLAVDPSSPLTGGALLGDRIRMQGHVDDLGIYMRSMASRGHLGGLARAAGETIEVMSRAGFDHVIVETIGVGQSEVEIMDLADLVVLVLGPGWGDRIQADKAGIVEIADLIVVNKGDRPQADQVRKALLETGAVQVLVTTATTGDGVGELWEAVERLLRSR